MNQQQTDFLSLISSSIEKYSHFTDVTVLNELFARFLKTVDLNMQAFLLSRITSELNTLRIKFPMAELMQAPPTIDLPKGGIEIGDISFEGVPLGRFSISRDDINRNMLIIASTGHGKTSLITTILRRLRQDGLTFLLFDMKRDYRFLALDDDTFYVDQETLKINPLEPPFGVSEAEWAPHFADVFSNSFSLLIGSRDFLLESLLNLYDSWKKDYPPSLRDLADYLESTAPKNSYSSVILGRIKSLLSSTSMFECNTGSPLDKLDKLNLVVGLDKFGIAEQGFITAFLLSHLYYMNINNSEKRGNLYKVVIIDDAHTVLDVNKERDYAAGIPVVHSIISKIRELGVGFIFSDQQASSLMSSAIQNTNLKFIGRINLSDDFDALFGRNAPEGVRAAVASLKQGEFLVISQNISSYVLLKPDFIPTNKMLDPSLIAVKNRLNRRLFTSFKADGEKEKERVFMEEVARNPYLNLSQHLSNLQPFMDQKAFNSIRSRLKSKGLIKEIEVMLSQDKASKFILAARDFTDGASDFKAVDELAFIKEVIRRTVLFRLKKSKVIFEGDEVGILVKGSKKTYIMIMERGENLAKILETNFDSVLDVTDGSIDEKAVLSRVFESKDVLSLSNLKALSVVDIKDFDPGSMLK